MILVYDRSHKNVKIITRLFFNFLGGGAEEEGELIEIVEMSIDEVQKYVNSESRLCPLALYNGVSWFLMNKKDRYEE